MKKMFLTLIALLTMTVSASAMSYEQARNEALFLTDKMAYELNLSDAQYEAAYEINLDYLMGVTGYDDVYGTYWERRNLDLSYVLYSWQWDAFRAATYFYRPLYWDAGFWHFGIYARYPHRDHFYFGRPNFYATYRGAHSWHMNHDRSYYYGHRDNFRPGGNSHFGMRDSWDRGDYRGGRNAGSSTRVTVDRNNNRMGNSRVGNSRMGNSTYGASRRDGNSTVNRSGNNTYGGSRSGGSNYGNNGYGDRGGVSTNGGSTYGGTRTTGAGNRVTNGSYTGSSSNTYNGSSSGLSRGNSLSGSGSTYNGSVRSNGSSSGIRTSSYGTTRSSSSSSGYRSSGSTSGGYRSSGSTSGGYRSSGSTRSVGSSGSYRSSGSSSGSYRSSSSSSSSRSSSGSIGFGNRKH